MEFVPFNTNPFGLANSVATAACPGGVDSGTCNPTLLWGFSQPVNTPGGPVEAADREIRATASSALGVRAVEGAAPDTVNVALIGAGTQGHALLNACVKLEGVRIAALCDIWADYNLVNASRALETQIKM